MAEFLVKRVPTSPFVGITSILLDHKLDCFENVSPMTALANATFMLGVGETNDGNLDSNHSGARRKLACVQLGDESLVQVHPNCSAVDFEPKQEKESEWALKDGADQASPHWLDQFRRMRTCSGVSKISGCSSAGRTEATALRACAPRRVRNQLFMRPIMFPISAEMPAQYGQKTL